MTNTNQEQYNDEYYQRKKQQKNTAGTILCRTITEIYDNLEYVVDYGCGDGRLTKPLEETGVKVFGIDYSEAAMKNNVLDDARQADLTEDINLYHYNLDTDTLEPDQVDLAVCIEVAEHLPEKHADKLIENITRHTNQVLFTAAKPGQPGKGHINCQPEKYWIKKFEEQGYTYLEQDTRNVRTRLRSTEMHSKTPWIPRNIMFFEKTTQ